MIESKAKEVSGRGASTWAPPAASRPRWAAASAMGSRRRSFGRSKRNATSAVATWRSAAVALSLRLSRRFFRPASKPALWSSLLEGPLQASSLGPPAAPLVFLAALHATAAHSASNPTTNGSRGDPAPMAVPVFSVSLLPSWQCAARGFKPNSARRSDARSSTKTTALLKSSPSSRYSVATSKDFGAREDSEAVVSSSSAAAGRSAAERVVAAHVASNAHSRRRVAAAASSWASSSTSSKSARCPTSEPARVAARRHVALPLDPLRTSLVMRAFACNRAASGNSRSSPSSRAYRSACRNSCRAIAPRTNARPRSP
mmetsp:Transcript_48940/g.111056  ORF Transcript_48940/g.111056 Transcript_48940/m.111056 type:complete len:315 (-) Transcript_48940:261-1205(-)